MSDGELRPPHDGPEWLANKALVVVAHERPFAVVYSAQHHIQAFIEDCGGGRDEFDLESNGIMYPLGLKDGAYVAGLRLEDVCAGDLPGTREYALDVHDWRPATKAEWEAHCNGEWPWDPSVP